MKPTSFFQTAAASPFLRNVSMLSGGSVLSMAVPILVAPVLGRLYAPAEYGALALYIAISAIVTVFATLQFQHAIVSEGSHRAARVVTWLCLVCAGGAAILTLVGVAVAWLLFLPDTALGVWIWILPAHVFLVGIVQSGAFMANRTGSYRHLAALPLLQTLTTAVMSIILGFSGWGTAGLLVSFFVGQFMMAAVIGNYLRKERIGAVPPLRLLYRRALKHWKFPFYTLPSEFAGQINMQLPIYALTAIGADSSVGFFARARQLVSMPVIAIGGSVSRVFRRDASKQYRATGNCRRLMLRTAGLLLALGGGPCLLVIWIGPELFEIYLGPNWGEAGKMARILAPMLLLRMVVSPLTTVLLITESQRLDLVLMLFSVLLLCIFVSSAWLLFSSVDAIVTAFSLGYGIIYVIYFVTCFWVGKK